MCFNSALRNYSSSHDPEWTCVRPRCPTGTRGLPLSVSLMQHSMSVLTGFDKSFMKTYLLYMEWLKEEPFIHNQLTFIRDARRGRYLCPDMQQAKPS